LIIILLPDFKSEPAALFRRAFSGARAIPTYGVLALTLLVGFSLRLYWMSTQTSVISFEAEYVRVAENLRAGFGLMSSYGGPETMYAPLYSLLIAGFSHLAKNAEIAAHLVSLFFGTLLIVPVFSITLRVYGLRAANLSAILVALHPLLIARSGSIYTEAVYPTLLMAALYWGIKSLELNHPRQYFLCGAFFGLAYLTRPEAFAYPVFFAFALFVLALLTRRSASTAFIAPSLVLAGFALVAFPYILFLHTHTGQWRLEGKWNINYTSGVRVHSGLSNTEALYGIDDNQKEVGPLLDPERFATYTPYSHSWRDRLRYMFLSARLNRQTAFEVFLSPEVGEPFVLILIAIGLFRHIWSPQRLIHETVLGVMVLSILILVYTAAHVESRYAEAVVPLTMPWVAKGLEELGGWARGLAKGLTPILVPHASLIGAASQMAICIPMMVLSFADVRTMSEFRIEQADHLYIKQAGLWLRNQKPEAKRVAAMNSIVPYYSRSVLIQFPYAGPSQTLRYFDSRDVEFIALEGYYSKAFPTIGEWFTHGIPDPRAQLVYDSGGPLEHRIAIYRWQRAGSAAAGP
jgi:4-amino-4-deoxy-L-arabinose transferase-like glycosyltransferase